MTDLASRLLEFVDDRLDHMLEAPDMWGSGESVELQILQLLEMRVLLLEPEHAERWRSVQSDYEHFLAKQFPGAPPTTLSTLLEDRPDELTTLLGQFVTAQRDAHRPGSDSCPWKVRCRRTHRSWQYTPSDDAPGSEQVPEAVVDARTVESRYQKDLP